MDLSYFLDDEGNERSRPQFVTDADLQRVVEKHKGNRPALIDQFIEMREESIQWVWYDDYHLYLEKVVEVSAWNAENAGVFTDDNGESFTVDPMPTPIEPVRPALRDVATVRSGMARLSKMEGVEFEGVMCSATKDDMYGLSSIADWIAAGNSTDFEFSNGNKLLLTADNYLAFQAVWVPFRASFF